MNERIKELAKQAGFASDKLGHLFGSDDIEKFAELIVKETLQVARAGMEFGDSMDEAVYTYFGVEE